MNQDQQTYQRSTNAAIVGLAVQVLLTVWMALMGLYAQSPAMLAATWHLVWGIPIWLFLLILYHQHRLERAESLETEQLSAADAQSAAIFSAAGEELAIARKRLDRLYKWGLNIISLFVAGTLLITGIWLLNINYPQSTTDLSQAALGENTNTMILMFMCAALAFIGFLVARYVAGMTIVKQWQLLRGGASYLMGNVLVAIIIFAGMLCAQLDLPVVLGYASIAIPAVMTAVGVEILLTGLLSAYRPRKPGEIPRPAFDSRVLGLLTSPESIAKIVNETINYQFGFEVSKSWFYQLLGKAITPLVILGLVVLIALSCIVIVEPDEQAIITYNGKIVNADAGPGLHFKKPWPFGKARIYQATQVHQIRVGSETGEFHVDEPTLWDSKHEGDHEDYLLTAPPRGESDQGEDKTGGAMLVGSQVLIEYRIDNLEKYTSTVTNPRRMLHAIAERRVNAYFVSHDIDELISQGRLTAGDELLIRIRDDVSKQDMGVEILYVALRAMHPPQAQEVADAFHKQIGALQVRQSRLEQAQQLATRELSAVAGSPKLAAEIDALISEHRQLNEKIETARQSSQTADSNQVKQLLKQRLDLEVAITDKIMNSPGMAKQLIHQARADRWRRVNSERSKAERFQVEAKAYELAPEYYKANKTLDAMSRGMAGARKTVIAVDGAKTQTYRIDLKDTGTDFGTLFNQE